MLVKLTFALIGAFYLMLPWAPASRAETHQAADVIGTYSGLAVDLGMGVSIGTSSMCGNLQPAKAPFTIQVTGSTPDQEIQKYAQIAKTDGQEALLRAVRPANLGSILFNNQTRVINLVRETRDDSGRRIICVFARLLDSSEAMCGADAKDYLLGYLELVLGNSGKKDGTLFVNASIRFDPDKPNAIGVADYGTYPARVLNLEVQGTP